MLSSGPNYKYAIHQREPLSLILGRLNKNQNNRSILKFETYLEVGGKVLHVGALDPGGTSLSNLDSAVVNVIPNKLAVLKHRTRNGITSRQRQIKNAICALVTFVDTKFNVQAFGKAGDFILGAAMDFLTGDDELFRDLVT